MLFERLAFEIGAGEVVWMRAANGFGKTTLLRVLAGLAAPDAGTLAWSGGAVRPPLLYLAHANALKDDLTVVESVRDQARLHGLPLGEGAVGDALRTFGMQRRARAPIRTLSQGQRRRVALARLCLSATRPLWLLDEPYDALDADGAATVGTLIAAHAAGGGSVLLTSHVPPHAAGAAVRVLELDRPDGR